MLLKIEPSEITSFFYNIFSISGGNVSYIPPWRRLWIRYNHEGQISKPLQNFARSDDKRRKSRKSLECYELVWQIEFSFSFTNNLKSSDYSLVQICTYQYCFPYNNIFQSMCVKNSPYDSSGPILPEESEGHWKHPNKIRAHIMRETRGFVDIFSVRT